LKKPREIPPVEHPDGPLGWKAYSQLKRILLGWKKRNGR